MNSIQWLHDTALIIIDVQKGLDDWEYYGGNRNNLDAEDNIKTILEYWRENDLPVIHVKHNSENPDSPLAKGKPGNEIKDLVLPLEGEPLFEKSVNSAFIGTGLQDYLSENNISSVVIVGLTTEHCISTSVRMSSNLGFKTYLVSDATAAFDKIGKSGKKYPAETIHEVCLANIDGEFAKVLTTAQLKKL